MQLVSTADEQLMRPLMRQYNSMCDRPPHPQDPIYLTEDSPSVQSAGEVRSSSVTSSTREAETGEQETGENVKLQ